MVAVSADLTGGPLMTPPLTNRLKLLMQAAEHREREFETT